VTLERQRYKRTRMNSDLGALGQQMHELLEKVTFRTQERTERTEASRPSALEEAQRHRH
jgi:hypothetical protein